MNRDKKEERMGTQSKWIHHKQYKKKPANNVKNVNTYKMYCAKNN